MKKLLLLILSATFSIASFAQTTWLVDTAHSAVNFDVRHRALSIVDGSFKKFDGKIIATKPDLTDAKIDFSVDVASIATTVEVADKNLLTDDFFKAEKYPTMTFVSTSFKKKTLQNAKQAANSYILSGKLTIRQVTNDVSFLVTYKGKFKDQQGNEKVGFKATTTINNLDFNTVNDPTVTNVDKDIKIKISLDLEFEKSK